MELKPEMNELIVLKQKSKVIFEILNENTYIFRQLNHYLAIYINSKKSKSYLHFINEIKI